MFAAMAACSPPRAEAFGAIKAAVGVTSGDKIGAISGDLASVEEMYALSELVKSLGSVNLDCRQDGAALDPSLGRASYLFNPSISGIDQADALLIIGANPRFEAAILNARIRKRWRRGKFPIGVIGERAELRYSYDYLGGGPDTLKDLIDGTHAFADVLKNAAKPMIIIGGARCRAPMAPAYSPVLPSSPARSAQSSKAGTALPSSIPLPRVSAASISASCRAPRVSMPPRC